MSVFIGDGNPGNISALYTGTFRDINKDDPLIHREQLQKNNIKYSDLLRTARSGWLEGEKLNFLEIYFSYWTVLMFTQLSNNLILTSYDLGL